MLLLVECVNVCQSIRLDEGDWHSAIYGCHEAAYIPALLLRGSHSSLCSQFPRHLDWMLRRVDHDALNGPLFEPVVRFKFPVGLDSGNLHIVLNLCIF